MASIAARAEAAPISPSLQTIARCAVEADCSERFVYELIARGAIAAVKMGRSTRVDVASWRRYLAGLPKAEVLPIPRKARG